MRVASWLDLCSGKGRALREAAARLPATAVLTGVDLVGPVVPVPAPPGVELVTASVTTGTPRRTYDLITCVHGLRCTPSAAGSAGSALARAASWLNPQGVLVAHLAPCRSAVPTVRQPAAR